MYFRRNPSIKYPHRGVEKKSKSGIHVEAKHCMSAKVSSFTAITIGKCPGVFVCIYLGNRQCLRTEGSCIATFGVFDLCRLGGRFGLVGSFGEAVGGLGVPGLPSLISEIDFAMAAFCAVLTGNSRADTHKCSRFWCCRACQVNHQISMILSITFAHCITTHKPNILNTM